MSELNQPKRLVLYADDDLDDLQFVRESFAEHAEDIQLHTFPGAIELLEYIANRKTNTPPCLVILDINMPRLDGKTALKLLRNIHGYENIPVVLFTTSMSPYDAQFAHSYNASFISKPLTSLQMDAITKNFLDHCNEGVKK